MESSKAGVFVEITGVCLVAVAVLGAISLASYNPADPSFNSYISHPANVNNLAGIIGASLADILAQFAGAVAWAAPLGVAYAGILLCCRARVGRLTFFGAGFSLLVISLTALVHIHWGKDPLFSGVVSGGAMGRIIAENMMVRWLSVYGSYVALSALLICSALLLMRMSVSTAIASASSAGGAMGVLSLKFGRLMWRLAGKLSKIRVPLLMEPSEENKRIKEKKAKIRSHGKLENLASEIFMPSEPAIINLDPDNPPPLPPGRKRKKDAEKTKDEFEQELFDFGDNDGDFQFPSIKLLDAERVAVSKQPRDALIKRSMILERKLLDFGVEGRVTQVLPGPVVTVYEFEPAPGIKVSRISSLSDDLAMVLRAISIRILAPVPGKSVVGIEVPNPEREMVYLKELLNSKEFGLSQSRLTLTLGKDVAGSPVIADLAQVPHLLIAGATGSGKSVGINAMILSILYKASPADVKFIMIDPKMLELSIYEGIPHLIAPVVTNPKKAANALRWAVAEMESRYTKLSELGVRNIAGYNRLVQRRMDEKRKKSRMAFSPGKADETSEDEKPLEKLPYIVVVIDELADLMLVSAKDVEDSLARLAQMARAAGIHLIVATQRPSVDVLTGLIKANFPARMSYQVRSRVDSRTILDSMGADTLLGKGDMLYLPPGTSRIQRVHGPFVSDQEIHRVVDFLKGQSQPEYNEEILDMPEKTTGEAEALDEETDEFYDRAVELVGKTRQASISMIQRRFRIGYNRAARIVETMEKQGLVGPANGLKPREVFIRELDDVETYN